MSATGIDLFAGAGGNTSGAIDGGVNMLWCANHNPEAVACHEKNHPSVDHDCQDLKQADWDDVPDHDIMFASPCCQGHSLAAGSKKRSIKSDKSRSTAWAVLDCLEARRAPIGVVENVTQFLNWDLYPAWKMAVETLGYTISPHIINAADVGVPQSRIRLFLLLSKSKSPLKLSLPKVEHQSARSFIDLNHDNHKWSKVEDRVSATRKRVANGRAIYGDLFLDAAYGTEQGGRSIDRPIGTITTVNVHSLVYGDKMRPLSIKELAAAQSFDENYIWPTGRKNTLTKELIGNAVAPNVAKVLTQELLKVA